MEAEGCLYDFRECTDLEGEGGVRERLDHRLSPKLPEISASFGGPRFIGVLLDQFLEVFPSSRARESFDCSLMRLVSGPSDAGIDALGALIRNQQVPSCDRLRSCWRLGLSRNGLGPDLAKGWSDARRLSRTFQGSDDTAGEQQRDEVANHWVRKMT